MRKSFHFLRPWPIDPIGLLNGNSPVCTSRWPQEFHSYSGLTVSITIEIPVKVASQLDISRDLVLAELVAVGIIIVGRLTPC